MNCLHETKYEFELSATFRIHIFGFRQKGANISCSSFEDLSTENRLWPNFECLYFCIHLKFELPPFWDGRSYGIKNYGVEVMAWHGLRTKFHENILTTSKVIKGGGHRKVVRQTDL
jgi:hypothetical protein